MPGAVLISDIAAALDRTLPVPLGVQLKGLIEYGISCGELPAGTRLPSVRELAGAGGIAPMTVATVYKELKGTGLIVARAGSGTFVGGGGRPGGSALFEVQTHIDAALRAAEAAGLSPADVTGLLNARIGRSRAREARPLRIVMVGVFQGATEAYAQEIGRLLRSGERGEAISIDAVTIDTFAQRVRSAAPPDLYVTLANRKAQVELLAGAGVPVVALSFIPSEHTRAQLAGVDPLARIGLVSVFPEFLALMKPGVLRFAPHVQKVDAALAGDPALAAFMARMDVVVYSTGAETAVAGRPAGTIAIEYRHSPDPHAVQQVLAPVIDRLRSGRAALQLKETVQ